MPNPIRAAAIAVLAACAIALAGCGKKGDPEYPAGTPMQSVAKPDGTTKQEPKKPTRPFILDPLLN